MTQQKADSTPIDLTPYKALFPHILAGDYILFVKHYIYLTGQGQTMLFPTGLEFELLYTKWKQILDVFSQPYTDEFLSQLTSFWIEVLSAQGGKVTPMFVHEVLKIIEEYELIIRDTITPLPPTLPPTLPPN